MWRGTFLILPLFVLIGAGCMIGDRGSEAEQKEVPEITAQKEVGEIEMQTSSMNVTIGETLNPVIPEVSLESAGTDSVMAPLEISLKSGNFFFDPPLIEAKAGQEVRVTVAENMGLHTFVVDEIAFKAQLGDGAVFSFIAPYAPGDYAFYCDTGEHRKLGMEGVLRIQ